MAPHVLCNPKYKEAKKYLCNSWSGPHKKYALMSFQCKDCFFGNWIRILRGPIEISGGPFVSG